MRIEQRIIDDVIVLDISGAITAGDNIGRLRDTINSLVFQGTRELLLNLRDVPHVDSCGLGELVTAHTTVSRAGGRVKLVHVTRHLHSLLAITRLVTVFETFDDERDAIRSFQAARVAT